MQISLSKALKTKNRIAGELNKLQQIFSRENSRKEGSTSGIDRELLAQKLEVKREKLIEIKTRIAEANGGIAGVLVRMGELKAKIAFMQTINTTDGKSMERRGFREEPAEVEFDAFLKQEDVDNFTSEITKEIDTLQDQADTYNATTKIEFDE